MIFLSIVLFWFIGALASAYITSRWLDIQNPLCSLLWPIFWVMMAFIAPICWIVDLAEDHRMR